MIFLGRKQNVSWTWVYWLILWCSLFICISREMGARIMFHVGGIAALTLLVNATTAAPLLRRLGLARRATICTFVCCGQFLGSKYHTWRIKCKVLGIFRNNKRIQWISFFRYAATPFFLLHKEFLQKSHWSTPFFCFSWCNSCQVCCAFEAYTDLNSLRRSFLCALSNLQTFMSYFWKEYLATASCKRTERPSTGAQMLISGSWQC